MDFAARGGVRIGSGAASVFAGDGEEAAATTAAAVVVVVVVSSGDGRSVGVGCWRCGRRSEAK
jgi:hypothetical protein